MRPLQRHEDLLCQTVAKIREERFGESIVKILHANNENLDRFVSRDTKAILLLWLSTWLISRGLVDGASISGIQISNLRDIIILSPPLLGILHYLIASHATVAGRLRSILREYYRQSYPSLAEKGLHLLADPPSFLTSERFLDHHQPDSRLSLLANQVWSSFLSMLAPAASLLALFHASYLLIAFSSWGLTESVLAIVLGGLVWTRGLLVWLAYDF